MIQFERLIEWYVLEEALREVALSGCRDNRPVYPYMNASISLKEVSYAEVKPTTLYVSRQHLDQQIRVESCLRAVGLDPLNLPGWVVLRDEEIEHRLTPPLVERFEDIGAYVIDGAHRTYRGLMLGNTTFQAVYIEGIDPECPGYALPNEWNEIVEYDTPPMDPILKKKYREGDYRSLYRDFGPINGSAMRS